VQQKQGGNSNNTSNANANTGGNNNANPAGAPNQTPSTAEGGTNPGEIFSNPVVAGTTAAMTAGAAAPAVLSMDEDATEITYRENIRR